MIRYKGRFMRASVCLNRLDFVEKAKQIKKDKEARKKAQKEQETDDITSNSKGSLLEGRRIVDLKLLAQQMWCTSCKSTLSLDYIESETRRVSLQYFWLGVIIVYASTKSTWANITAQSTNAVVGLIPTQKLGKLNSLLMNYLIYYYYTDYTEYRT